MKMFNKPQSDLFKLIKDMNGPERAYFKKMAKRHSTANNSHHIQLFNLICSASENDEALFIHELKIKSAAQFSMIKKYLFNELLEVLSFLKRSSPNMPIVDYRLLQIYELIDRRLFVSARKLIEKERVVAEKNQFLVKKTQLLKAEYALLKNSYERGVSNKLLTQNNLIGQEIEHTYLAEKLWWHFRHILLLRDHSNNRLTEKEISEAAEQKSLLQNIKINNLHPPIIKILHATCLAFACYLTQQHEEGDGPCNDIIMFWQQYPFLIGAYPELFREGAQVILYHSLAWLDAYKTAEYLSILQKSSQQIKKEEELKKWEILQFNTTLKIYHKLAQYDKVKAIIDKKTKYIIQTAEDVLTINELQIILTSIAISYFVLGMLKEADEMVYKLKGLYHTSRKEDVFFFTLIFHLLIMYERQEWYRLEKGIESAYQQLYNLGELRPFEKDLMLYIKQLAATADKQETKKLIQTILWKLDDYKNDPVKKMYFHYFNYYGWLKSRLEGISYREFAARQAAGVSKDIVPGNDSAQPRTQAHELGHDRRK